MVETVSTTIAIQVETGKSDIQGNLIKLGRFKADQKIVVATNKETEIKINELIKELHDTDRDNHPGFVCQRFFEKPPCPLAIQSSQIMLTEKMYRMRTTKK